MKTNIKSFVAGSITTLTIVGIATTALAVSGTVNFSTVNIKVGDTQVASAGDTYTLSNGAEAPYSISYVDVKGGSTTYVPIRKFSELVGSDVSWDSASGSVVVGNDGLSSNGNQDTIITSGTTFSTIQMYQCTTQTTTDCNKNALSIYNANITIDGEIINNTTGMPTCILLNGKSFYLADLYTTISSDVIINTLNKSCLNRSNSDEFQCMFVDNYLYLPCVCISFGNINLEVQTYENNTLKLITQK